jgi:hypothetical protein
VKKRIVLLATLASIAVEAHGARAAETVLTGKISDSLCGASHAAMAAKQGSKVSDRDCVTACVSYSTENSPKLVFVGESGKVYQIANQRFAGLLRHAGEPVSVTGDVNGNTLTISKLDVTSTKTKTK